MRRPAYLQTLATKQQVAYSSINKGVLRELRTLNLVKIETRGRSRRVVVQDQTAFQLWIEAHYPDTEIERGDLPQRAANIARSRSSKRGKSTHANQPVLLKWFSPDFAHPLLATTNRYGMVGVTSDKLSILPWPDKWWLLTVENWEPFANCYYEPAMETVVVVYLGGNVSETVLQSLASVPVEPTRALYFGDYDWSGLQIWQRVQRWISTLKIYAPLGLETLFQKYAQPDLASKQKPIMLPDAASKTAKEIVGLISDYNGGLEQEIVPLPTLTDFQR